MRKTERERDRERNSATNDAMALDREITRRAQTTHTHSRTVKFMQ